MNLQKNQTKMVIVPMQDKTKKTTYIVERPTEHVTFMFTIGYMMDFVWPLIIVNRKTMDDDLLPFGFHSGLLGKIISSETGYATSDVFEVYVKDILILHVCKLRRAENLPDAKAGILVDGHYSHKNPKTLAALKENNIETYLLPPHLSHLTQPLDQSFFSNWKKEYKRRKPTTTLKSLSSRIIHATNCLQRVSTFSSIIGSFGQAGIKIKMMNEDLELNVDCSIINTKDRMPTKETAKTKLTPKRKTTKLQYCLSEKEFHQETKIGRGSKTTKIQHLQQEG
jgi:hypothetical protein